MSAPDKDPIAAARARFKARAAVAWRMREPQIEAMQNEDYARHHENEQAANDFYKGMKDGRNG